MKSALILKSCVHRLLKESKESLEYLRHCHVSYNKNMRLGEKYNQSRLRDGLKKFKERDVPRLGFAWLI